MRLAEREALRQRIAWLLLYNPWCTLGMIRAFFELDWRGAKGLLADQTFFERARIPSRDPRGYQDVYALTVQGQSELAGRCRPQRFLAEALLQSYARLAGCREALVDLRRAGRLAWSISPWKMAHNSFYFDALVCLNRGPGQGILAAIVFPMTDARLEWYLDLVKTWAGWRKDTWVLPALLVLWDPPLNPRALGMLGQAVPERVQSEVVCFSGKSRAPSWRFKPLHPVPRNPVQPGSLPLSLLPQEAYLPDGHKISSPKAETLRSWAARSQGVLEGVLAFFYQARTGDIRLLETLARFPGLTRESYRVLDPGSQAGRALTGRLSRLEAGGLITAGQQAGELYFLGDKGLRLLAGLNGLGLKALNRYLGWPVRPGRFRGQREHLGIALDFMLRLKREKALLAWDFTAVLYEFAGTRPHGRPGARRIVIWPDSAGALQVAEKQYSLFWLEVDRGTRAGRRLEWKLEKYFLAQTADLASGPVPVVLYLVDTGRMGQDESRLRGVGRILEKLGKNYPGTRLTLLLATGDLARSTKGALRDARIWRAFQGKTLGHELVSLRETLGGRK